MSKRQFAARAALLTALFEGITLVLRFGGGLQSSVHTAFLADATLGLRIHHGYLGALMLLGLPVLARTRPQSVPWTAAVGVALIASDLIHHFLVLWPLTGSPCFDFLYPCH
jgi:hypothetical protein